MTIPERMPALSVSSAGSTYVGLCAERDRAAAALDRLEAAVLRLRAAEYLSHVHQDTLTGALQREAGRDRLVREMTRADRTGGSVALGFLDVAGLKLVNDRWGHATGDLVLAAVGTALIEGLRPYDIVVRYGGDEFVCALPDTTGRDASIRIEGIAATLRSADPPIEISHGVVLRLQHEPLDDALARADQAMYASRSTGARASTTTPLAEVPAARRG